MRPVPVGLAPELAAFLTDVSDRLREIEQPTFPHVAFACLEADLPDAALYPTTLLIVTDIPVIAFSDGTDWIRADDGTAI